MDPILVIGSYNVGLTVYGPSIPLPGQTIMGERFAMGPGGKGSNQAITIARLGGTVTFMTRIGHDVFGKEALELFKKEDIDTSYVSIDSETHTGAGIIFVDSSGQNAIGVAPGANYTLTEEMLDRNHALFRHCKYLLLQLEISDKTVYHALSLANKAKTVTVLNPAPARRIDEDYFPMIDIITPNESEAECLTGIVIQTKGDAVRAGKWFVDRGIGTAIITLGADGALMVNKDEEHFFPAEKVIPTDTTGAGDAFNGALVYRLASGESLESAMAFACKVAALSVMKEGVVPSLPFLNEVEEKFA